MPYADEESMYDDFAVEIIDLPADVSGKIASDDDHFTPTSTTRRLAGRIAAKSAIADRDDDFEIEIADLPADGTHRLFSLLSDLWERLMARLPEIRVTMQREEEPDDDEGGFSLTVRDLPPEAEAEEQVRDVANKRGAPIQAKKSLWRSKRALIRPLFALSTILLVVLVVIPASMPFLQRNVLSHLFPAPQAAQPTPISTSPAYSRIHVCILDSSVGGTEVAWDLAQPVNGTPLPNCPSGSDSTGAASGSGNVVPLPTTVGGPPIGAVPTNCQPGSAVTDAHTIGSRPVWVSGFDGPQATIHLGDTPQTLISGKVGWSVVTTIWMHFDQDIKVTFSSSNQIGSGAAPLFKFDLEDPLTQSLSFRSHHPSIPDYAGNLTNNWFMTMYFPAAGCYVLSASWPNGGGWHLNFAVGR